MLRVGLTGELGSGKSTVAEMLRARGAVVLSSDEMGRAMMAPGQEVHTQIAKHFGDNVVAADGTLDRRALAKLSFQDGRVEELNAIVHPAVIAEQTRMIEETRAARPDAIVVVESALLFSTRHAGGSGPWSGRFDEILLVTAPEQAKVQRFVLRAAAGRVVSGAERAALEEDARRRLAAQHAAKNHDEECIVIRNSGDVAALEKRVAEVWRALERMASR